MGDLVEELRASLTGEVCLMGLGNLEYGDDGFGVRLAEELIAAGVPGVVVAGTGVERAIAYVAGSFQHLVFLDAVDFGGAPGSVVFLDSRQIASRFPQISTHKISLGVLAKLVEAGKTTRAWLLGVQPKSLEIGQQLTTGVQNTLETLVELLCRLNLSAGPDEGVALARENKAEASA